VKRAITIAVMCSALALGGVETWQDRFAFAFGAEPAGTVFIGDGATGGEWSAIPSAATNVICGARAALSLGTTANDVAEFTSAASTTDAVTRVTFSVCPSTLTQDPAGGPEDAVAALTPALFAGGKTGWIGRAAGTWVALNAEGAEPVEGQWSEGAIEMRTVGGEKFVSYLIQVEGEWKRLTTAAGRSWFPTSANGVRGVSFSGTGVVADFAVAANDEGERPALHWIGGMKGDWDDRANWSWSAGGESAGVVPGANGQVAMVSGLVELTRGEEVATVENLVVVFTEAGASIVSGAVRTVPVELDTKRPRAGRPLTAKVGTFLGWAPDGVGFVWRRGTTGKSYDVTPVSTTASFTPSTSDYEHWFSFAATNSLGTLCSREFFFSKLPVAYLATDDGAAPSSKKEEHAGTIFLQGNDEWKSPYAGAMSIKVRGNTTASYSKKPYKIKLAEKTKLFGMPKNRHWVLLANYNDMSHLRNKLAYDFANEIGSLGMESTWVDCVLNGAFIGCYQLCEHIRIGEHRVNIFDWEETVTNATDLSGINVTTNDITGGYLYEFSTEYDAVSKFHLTSGKLYLPVMLNSPEYLNTNPAMMNYCRSSLQRYFDACTAANGCVDGVHWSELSDLDSMLAYWFVNELFANNDATKKSRFAYQDRGEKLMWGPVWDFDWGLASIATGNTPERWACSVNTQGDTSRDNSFFKEWSSDPWYCARAWEWYWQRVRAEYVKVFEAGGLIDRYAEYLAEAGTANDARWPRDRSFAADIAILKTFFNKRLAWLDAQFADVPTLMASLRTDIATHPYTADYSALPIALDAVRDREEQGGVLWRVYGRRAVKVAFALGCRATSVEVVVNGRRQLVMVPDASEA